MHFLAMHGWAVCYLLSYLASSAVAVRHPLHRHRHDNKKRTEVLIVEEDVTVEVIEETIYLPGPPPKDYEQSPEKKEHEHAVHPLTTFTLPDGSVTVFAGPEPTSRRSGHGAGRSGEGNLHVALPNSGTTGVGSGAGEASSLNPSSTIADSNFDSYTTLSSTIGAGPGSATISAHPSASLGGSDRSDPSDTASPREKSTASTSTVADSSPTRTAPTSSMIPAQASSAASSAPTPSHSGAYPFSALVAFGDNLSDNGNGSYAHNVAADNATHVVKGNAIYGARTWTNGPVAVSYLADLLGVPMDQNFAFGHAWGGANFGATIDDTMQQSNFSASIDDGPWFSHGEFSSPCWGAPSAKVQIADYIAGGVNKHALHTLWIGANDMNAAYYGTVATDDNPTRNADFAKNISTKIPSLVRSLLDAGAPYVLVANLYPKHLAPLWPNFLSLTNPADLAALGTAIASANTALKTALTTLPPPYAGKIIYHDAFTFLSNLYQNPGSAFPNIRDTNGWPSFCDGDAQQTPFVASIAGTVVDGVTVRENWDYCVRLGHQAEWFWMQYLDMTSHVHQLVAEDMERAVKSFFLG